MTQVHVQQSRAKGNAPRGYVIARVVVAPGFFVEAELNPYTAGTFRGFLLMRGREDAPHAECEVLVEFDRARGAVADAFDFVITWYDRELIDGVAQPRTILARAGRSRTGAGRGWGGG